MSMNIKVQTFSEYDEVYIVYIEKQTHILVIITMTISEKAMAPHSNTLAWKIPWTEESGRLQSTGL